MTTCIYCGGQTPDGSKFCELCGAALPVEVPADQMFTVDGDTAPAVSSVPVDPAGPVGEPNAGQDPYWQGNFQQPVQGSQQPFAPQDQLPSGQQYQQPSAQQPLAQGQAPYTAPGTQGVVDSGSIGWAILGFIIPIVGIVLFFVWHNTKPQSAKMSLIGAIVSIVLSLLLRIMS